jgi:hypothetical protein
LQNYKDFAPTEAQKQMPENVETTYQWYDTLWISVKLEIVKLMQ